MFRPAQRTVLLAMALAIPVSAPASAAPGTKPEPVTLAEFTDSGRNLDLAAGAGHVVAVRTDERGSSELMELASGSPPRTIRRFGTPVGMPSVGTDARGNAVVVVSPCPRYDRQGLPSTPRCSLRAVRIDDGSTTVVPRSRGAYAGTVEGASAVVVRRSKTVGSRIAYLPRENAPARSLPIDGTKGLHAEYIRASYRVVEGLSLRGGTLAAVVHAGGGGGYSLLLQSRQGRPWQLLARSGYGEASGIPRIFRGPQVTPAGTVAYYDGGDNDAGWIGRWNSSGSLVRQVPTRPYGVPTINPAAAWDGRRLVVAEFRYPDDEGDPRLVVTSHGPIPLG